MPKHEAVSGIAIRRVRPSDSEDLRDFYVALSEADLRARFLGYTRGLSATAARAFCTLDHMHDAGFVALAMAKGPNRIVGHVCLACIGPRQLELGIAVASDCNGMGIGRRLFDAALAWSQDRRFVSIVATCYADNSRVLGLLTSAPFGASVGSSDAGVVDVTIPLEPLISL